MLMAISLAPAMTVIDCAPAKLNIPTLIVFSILWPALQPVSLVESCHKVKCFLFFWNVFLFQLFFFNQSVITTWPSNHCDNLNILTLVISLFDYPFYCHEILSCSRPNLLFQRWHSHIPLTRTLTSLAAQLIFFCSDRISQDGSNEDDAGEINEDAFFVLTPDSLFVAQWPTDGVFATWTVIAPMILAKTRIYLIRISTGEGKEALVSNLCVSKNSTWAQV